MKAAAILIAFLFWLSICALVIVLLAPAVSDFIRP